MARGGQMADVFTPKKRSEIMSLIRGRDTAIEIAVRKHLHKLGLRFRVNVKSMPGRPDVVLPRHRAVVFVHGCFWHGHGGCRLAVTPKTNTEFWRNKIGANRKRDVKVRRELQRLGWRSFTIWECGISIQGIDRLADRIRLVKRHGGRC